MTSACLDTQHQSDLPTISGKIGLMERSTTPRPIESKEVTGHPTRALLKRNDVTEYSLTHEDIDADVESLKEFLALEHP